MNNPFSELSKAIESTLKYSQFINDSVKSAIKTYLDFYDKINEYLESVNIPELLYSFGKGLEQTTEDVENFKKVIVALGYPPSPSLDIRLMRAIGREYVASGEENLIKVIDETMLNFYNPTKINQIKLDWNRHLFLRERIKLFNQALNAHNLGMYALVSPSLLSQMEGVIIERYDIKQRVNGEQFRNLVKDLFTESDNIFDFNNELRKFYLDNVLVGFHHGREIKSDVSRHAILHGGDKPISFGTEVVSLKVILMMDSIIDRLSELNEEEIQSTKDKYSFN